MCYGRRMLNVLTFHKESREIGRPGSRKPAAADIFLGNNSRFPATPLPRRWGIRIMTVKRKEIYCFLSRLRFGGGLPGGPYQVKSPLESESVYRVVMGLAHSKRSSKQAFLSFVLWSSYPVYGILQQTWRVIFHDWSFF